MKISKTIPYKDDFCVEKLGLVDAEPNAAFDAITKLATRFMDVPVALISIVQEEQDRQYFASQQGLEELWATSRQTPLSHSFCQHVKRTGVPLVISNALENPLVRDNLAIRDLNVVAYLGVPIRGPDGAVLGAICVIDSESRDWKEADVSRLEDLALCVNDEILLRAAMLTKVSGTERKLRYSNLREAISSAFMAPDLTVDQRFEELLRMGCRALDMQVGRLIKTSDHSLEVLFEFNQDHVRSVGKRAFSDSLSEIIGSVKEIIFLPDALNRHMTSKHLLDGSRPRSFIGGPVIIRDAQFGSLEFSSSMPRQEPWSEEELSIVSIISMFAAANLGLHGQITKLKKSESALLSYLADQNIHSCVATA